MDVQKQIEEMLERLTTLENAPPTLLPHRHTGTDSERIYFDELGEKKIWKEHTIIGAAAATAANYTVFFIAPLACFVSRFEEVHQTAGSDGSAVTVTLEKLTSAQALDGGTVLLDAALSLKSTADTVQAGTIISTIASKNLAAGDRLALKDSGTLTAVANVTVLVELTVL